MTDSIDPFERPELRLQLARANIDNLKAELNAFLASCDCTEFLHDEGNGWLSYRVQLPTKLPAIHSERFTEIASDLKHTLDQAMNAAYTLHTGEVSERIHFPTGRGKEDFEKEVGRRCISAGVHPDVTTIAVKSDCFELGNPPLYTLSVFARHKHRDWLAASMSPNSVSIPVQNGYIDVLSFSLKPLDIKGCYEIARFPATSKNNIQLQYTFQVVIEGEGAFQNKEVIQSLNEMLEMVSKLVAEIKNAAIRSRTPP